MQQKQRIWRRRGPKKYLSKKATQNRNELDAVYFFNHLEIELEVSFDFILSCSYKLTHHVCNLSFLKWLNLWKTNHFWKPNFHIDQKRCFSKMILNSRTWSFSVRVEKKNVKRRSCPLISVLFSFSLILVYFVLKSSLLFVNNSLFFLFLFAW